MEPGEFPLIVSISDFSGLIVTLSLLVQKLIMSSMDCRSDLDVANSAVSSAHVGAATLVSPKFAPGLLLVKESSVLLW